MIARAALLAILGLSAAASLAAADPLWPGYPVAAGALPPYEVVTILRSAGFAPLRRPFLRGPDYVVRAVDRVGTDVRVIVDARSGRIVSAIPLDALPYRPRAVARYAPPPPAYGPDEGPAAYPPAYRPPRPYAYEPPQGPENGRAPAYEPYLPEEGPPPAAPQRSAALTPPKTPLPRPRPAEAPAKDASASAAPEQHSAAPPDTSPPAKSEAPAKADGNDGGKSSPPGATAMPPVAPLE